MIFLLCAAGLFAQTNSSQRPINQTLITSDHGEFDMNHHKALYYGNVHVDDPKMKLRCERLTADTPENGGRMNRIVCETNVVIDFLDEHGETNHVTSDKAIYDYHIANGVTNETVTFTGHARSESEKMIIKAEPIFWDNIAKKFSFTHPEMIIKQSMNFMPTNSLPTLSLTNKLPAVTNRPTMTTNKPLAKMPAAKK